VRPSPRRKQSRATSQQSSPLRFAADWLGLRERLDAAARNRNLAIALAERLPERPRLLDLGAGTGSLFRYLAPIIGRPQRWVFADADEALLQAGLARTAHWAEGRGLGTRFSRGSPPSALTILTPVGSWRIETLRVDLARVPRGLPLADCDAVVCSALLDLVSRQWMERLFSHLHRPFYASLTVDGRDAWFPRHQADLAVRTAFRRDQDRDKGLGLALGVAAAGTARALLAARGFETHEARSDWRIPRGETRLASLLARMTAQAAREAEPGRRGRFEAWMAARAGRARAGSLTIRIGHRDILALPPGGG
jgi:SAM-dependent methyltransferase